MTIPRLYAGETISGNAVVMVDSVGEAYMATQHSGDHIIGVAACSTIESGKVFLHQAQKPVYLIAGDTISTGDTLSVSATAGKVAAITDGGMIMKRRDLTGFYFTSRAYHAEHTTGGTEDLTTNTSATADAALIEVNAIDSVSGSYFEILDGNGSGTEFWYDLAEGGGNVAGDTTGFEFRNQIWVDMGTSQSFSWAIYQSETGSTFDVRAELIAYNEPDFAARKVGKALEDATSGNKFRAILTL